MNNIQPGGPSRRYFAFLPALMFSAAVMFLAPGTMRAASLTSTPAGVSFGTVPVGNKVTQTLAVKNPGTSTVVVSSASISGPGFSISSLPTPFSLSSGATTYFAVGFKPTAAGTAVGTLTLKTSSGTTVLSVILAGAGSVSTKSLISSTAKLDFGSETVGNSETLSVALINNGNSSVTISGVSISGSSAYSVTSGISGATLAAGQSAIMKIVFAPKSAGTFNSTITVVSNATNTAPAVSVTGAGVGSASHSVALNWSASTSSGVIGYNVYRSTISGSSYSRITSSPTASLKFTDGNVASGQTYYYVVSAVQSSGVESALSPQVKAVIP